MAVEFMPFAPEQALNLRVQDAQRVDGFGADEWTLERWQSLSRQSFTAWQAVRGGVFLGCAGVMHIWDGRAFAWMAVGRDVQGTAMLAIHRKTMSVLDDASRLGYRRIETTVRVGFREGIRWVRMLGFEREGRMKRYAPDGGDHFLYARVVP